MRVPRVFLAALLGVGLFNVSAKAAEFRNFNWDNSALVGNVKVVLSHAEVVAINASNVIDLGTLPKPLDKDLPRIQQALQKASRELRKPDKGRGVVAALGLSIKVTVLPKPKAKLDVKINDVQPR